MVVSQVLRTPAAEAPVIGQAALLEAVQAPLWPRRCRRPAIGGPYGWPVRLVAFAAGRHRAVILQ